MIWTLLQKELCQHRWAIAITAMFAALGLFLVLVAAVGGGQAGSAFFALGLFGYLMVFASFILAHQLVVIEYRSHTQLFLEALPVSRTAIIAVKYCLGLTIILATAFAALALVTLLSQRTEFLTLRFLFILTVRLGLFVTFVFTFFFMAGFLGRLRWIFYVLVVALLAALHGIYDVPLERTGVLHLLGEDFAYERETLPWDAVTITAGLTIACLVVIALLGLGREGSVAQLLGERMAYREKVILGAVVLGAIATLSSLEAKKPKEPYHVSEASSVTRERVFVQVSPPSPRAMQLANRLSEDLEAMAVYLDLAQLQPVFIALRGDFDPDRHQAGSLDESEGTVLRSNYLHEDWRYEELLETVVGYSLYHASNGRVDHEPRFWIIDGFTLFWSRRSAPQDDLDARPELLLRALYGTEHRGQPIGRPELRDWFTWQREVGHYVTAGIAWSGLRTLERECGEEACRQFLRDTLARDTPSNALTTFSDLRDPIEARLQRAADLEFDTFLQRWNDALDQWRLELAEELAVLPRLEGQVRFEPLSESSYEGRFRFDPPAEASARASLERPVLLYGFPPPFSPDAPEALLRRYPLDLEESSQGTLYEDFTHGTRVTYTFAARCRTLDCRIISGWRTSSVEGLRP